MRSAGSKTSCQSTFGLAGHHLYLYVAFLGGDFLRRAGELRHQLDRFHLRAADGHTVDARVFPRLELLADALRWPDQRLFVNKLVRDGRCGFVLTAGEEELLDLLRLFRVPPGDHAL